MIKRQVDIVDATPSKRLYLSIIADYDLNKAICELVDNALDIWTRNGKIRSIKVEILLDQNQQIIKVIDNGGGFKKSEFSLIIAPGHSSNQNGNQTIGIFGVGTKRAVVALSQDVAIKTGDGSQLSYQVEFDDRWLQTQDDWKLPVYEIDEVLNGETVIELHRLRTVITDDRIKQLEYHLGFTYARFLENQNVFIFINSQKVRPCTFENWAFPPNYQPRKYFGRLRTTSGFDVEVNVLAGLTCESSPSEGDYGVFFYCNDRLIVKGLKSLEVGFTTGLAGKPHPNLSLARIIVSLKGEPRLMPWNSSKSNINTDHEVFIALQKWLVHVVKDYTSLSRRLQGHWPEEVFVYKKGNIVDVEIDDFPKANTSYLPPLPLSKPRYSDIIKQQNRRVANSKPWTKGIYETIIAVDLINRQSLEQKNRIALLLLDSNLEIAFKEFLVNETTNHYTDAQLLNLFSKRHLVHQEIRKYTKFSAEIWGKINYFYKIRCELVHKRATVSIPDSDIIDFRNVTERVFKTLFKLKFDE